MTIQHTPCGYEGEHFDRGWADATCLEGYLYDLGSNDGTGALRNGGDIPCPSCNTAHYLEFKREQIQDTGHQMTSAVNAWEAVVCRTLEINQDAALRALTALPRHVFWNYKKMGISALGFDDHEAIEQRVWPWPIAALSSHQNIEIMRAATNPPGIDPEA